MMKPSSKEEICWCNVFRKLSKAGILTLIPVLKGPFKMEDTVFWIPQRGGCPEKA